MTGNSERELVKKKVDWEISNQAPEKEKVQRLGESRRAKRPEVPGPSTEGEDIVCSAVKVAAARKGGQGYAPWRTTGTEQTRFSRFDVSNIPCLVYHGDSKTVVGESP